MDYLHPGMANLNLHTPKPGGSTQSQFLSATFETPHRQNMSSTNVFLNGTLEEQRKAVQEDLGPIPEVTVAFMLEHIVPNSNVDVEATLKKLKDDGILMEDCRWKAFNGQSPSTISRHLKRDNPSRKNTNPNMETKIFKNMKEVYSSIISGTQFYDRSTTRKPTLVFDQNPDRVPASDTNVRSRPDGYGILTPEQQIHTKRVSRPSQVDPHYDPKIKKNPLVLALSKSEEWFDIVCVEEYKIRKTREDRSDNAFKVIWSIHHIMNVDHRRRFCFGITIEDEEMRIWFACRQMVVVTQPFNFNTNPSQLVQLIASLAYATPTQLGYDPTMKLQWGSDGYCYDIECRTQNSDRSYQTRLYRTHQVISHSAYNLRGRATRVYLVELLENQKNRGQSQSTSGSKWAVLKDSWIDTNRSKEGDTLQKILEGASEDEKSLFLTVYHHGAVQIDGQDDSTDDLILRGRKIKFPDERARSMPVEVNPFIRGLNAANDLPSDANDNQDPSPVQIPRTDPEPVEEARIFSLHMPDTKTNVTKASQGTTNVSQATNTTPAQAKKPRDALRHNTHVVIKKHVLYSPKVHYRIVFKEAGESLSDIVDDGRMTTKMLDRIMKDILMALRYLAKKGYVHRDLSAGNIIWYKGHAKLADFEFAKPYSTRGSPYVRTGTYHFMPGEVMKQKYSVAEYMAQNAKIPFIYNPIHDIEALWWVGVYCALWHFPAPYTLQPQLDSESVDLTARPLIYKYRDFNDQEREYIQDVTNHANMLFPTFYSYPEYELRMEEIHEQGRFASRVNGPYPEVIHFFNFCLDSMRHCISSAYNIIQSSLPHTEASYFTDVLRIGNPSTPQTSVGAPAKSAQLPVHDMILQILETWERSTTLEDAILWPIDSPEEMYHKFLMVGEARERLRPRTHPRGFINMDVEEIYYED